MKQGETGEERAGYFTLLCSCGHVAVSVLCLFLVVSWTGLGIAWSYLILTYFFLND